MATRDRGHYRMEIRRLGVHRSWRLPRLLKELETRIQDDWRDNQLRGLDEFVGTVAPGAGALGAASVSLLNFGLDQLRQAALSSLASGRPQSSSLALATSFLLRGFELEMFRLDLHYKEPRNAWGGFDNGAMLLAQMFSLGWISSAERTGGWFVASVLNGHYYDANPPYRNCAAWFVTRLFADWRGSKVARWPEHHYPAAIYDELRERWRTPDANQLVENLLAACDWHTHECWKWSDQPKKHGDFTVDPYFGWPIEIHMIFRLRESLGLRNPDLDHPLMQTGLGAYRTATPVVTDPLLEAVTAKAVALYPQLAERLTPLSE